MSPKGKARTFEEEEADWYERLRASGFIDIEATQAPGRPLKRWDSFALLSERGQRLRIEAYEYQQAAEAFFHGPHFPEVCRIAASHGNSVSAQAIARVFEMHVQGESQRAIARKLRVSKTCVAKVLAKLNHWMRLL